MKLNTRLNIYGFVLIAFAAICDALQWGFSIVLAPVFAILPVVIVFALSTRSRKNDLGRAIIRSACFMSLLLGVIFWFYYAIVGDAGETGAQHMYFLFFPVIHLIAGLLFMVVAYVLALIVRAISNKSLNSDAASVAR